MCYRDRTYCSFYKTCIVSISCPRALTEEVIEAANKFGLPICQFEEQPSCYQSAQKQEDERKNNGSNYYREESY